MIQPIYERAAAQIAYIRDTINHSVAFTAVPGAGLVCIGGTALASWYLMVQMGLDRDERLFGWMINALIALPIGLVAMHRKARRLQLPVWSGPGRRFLLALAPSGLAAAALTGALYQHNMPELVRGVWLTTYGIGVMAAGAYSIKPVPIMGALFLFCGVLYLLLPGLTTEIMPVAFGGLHILFGYIIWKDHGG